MSDLNISQAPQQSQTFLNEAQLARREEFSIVVQTGAEILSLLPQDERNKTLKKAARRGLDEGSYGSLLGAVAEKRLQRNQPVPRKLETDAPAGEDKAAEEGKRRAENIASSIVKQTNSILRASKSQHVSPGQLCDLIKDSASYGVPAASLAREFNRFCSIEFSAAPDMLMKEKSNQAYAEFLDLRKLAEEYRDAAPLGREKIEMNLFLRAYESLREVRDVQEFFERMVDWYLDHTEEMQENGYKFAQIAGRVLKRMENNPEVSLDAVLQSLERRIGAGSDDEDSGGWEDRRELSGEDEAREIRRGYDSSRTI